MILSCECLCAEKSFTRTFPRAAHCHKTTTKGINTCKTLNASKMTTFNTKKILKLNFIRYGSSQIVHFTTQLLGVVGKCTQLEFFAVLFERWVVSALSWINL